MFPNHFILTKTSLLNTASQAPLVHTFNPSYLGVRDLEDCDSRPGQTPPQKKKKVCERLPLNGKELDMMVYACHSSNSGKC
jgi:hypothetical protein